MSVARYRYEALTSSGGIKRGRIEAATSQDVFAILAEQGLTPLSVRPPRRLTLNFTTATVTLKDVAAFTRELSVVVESRIPIAQGIRGIAESERHPELRRLLLSISQNVEAGTSLRDAIDEHRDIFGDVYVETLSAAEKTGSLSDILSLLADMLDRQLETRQQLRSALMYPAVVLTVVAAALAVILIFVVPRFSATFESSGIELPMITVVIQALAVWLKEHWMFVAAGIASAFVGLIVAWRSTRGRSIFERLILRMPVFGSLDSAITTARFSRVFGLCLRSGLDVVDSLTIGGTATGRACFTADAQSMCDRLRSGAALRTVLDGTPYLPGFARRMLSAGKDAGELAHACDVVARHYERQSSHLTKSVNQMLEPLLTVCLAGVVLLVALSVFLPMWKMVSIAH